MRIAALVILLAFSAESGVAPANGQEPRDRFEVAGITRAEAAQILSRLQKAVAAHDVAGVSTVVRFPLIVKGRAGPENASELARDFDKVFTDNVRRAILNQKIDEIFANWQGLMIGKGEVWINALCEKDSPAGQCKNRRLRVVSINN
jgi:hypothetical protein